MTIKHYCRVVKLDGRYKFYNQGFRYRVEYNLKIEQTKWFQALEWCRNTYGSERKLNDRGRGPWASYTTNKNYRTMIAKNRNFRYLFLSSEEAVTMLLLAA